MTEFQKNVSEDFMHPTLYDLQQKTWAKIFDHLDDLRIKDTILCGGTALARFYLNHRISYDLDFFVPTRFDPEQLLVSCHQQCKTDPLMTI